jgi:four helix bundle protein
MGDYDHIDGIAFWVAEMILGEPRSKYSKEEKAAFITRIQQRTKKFAVQVINLVNRLPQTIATKVIGYQLVKAATSVGANYRAACVARSRAEFRSKMSICVEEADESLYWLEVLRDADIECDETHLQTLLGEIKELVGIFSRARNNTPKS